MRAIRHVIWDFNGTLLDDVDCCVDTLNTLLIERNLQPISRAQYRARFGFPVRPFYVELGFDFEREDFERVAGTYMARYAERIAAAGPQQGAHAALTAVRLRGAGQSVLSAMEHSLLQHLLRHFDLHEPMTHVRGLDHNGASSKVALGLALRRELPLEPDELLLVGDTLHDHETARALGCRCLLFAHGHQDPSRLSDSGAPVIESLAQVAAAIDESGAA